MSQEHRKEQRFPVAAIVPLWRADAGAAIDCPATDISSHGIFLEMQSPLPVDTFVKIGPANARVPGRVVFVLSTEQAKAMGRSGGVGLQLTTAIDPDGFLLACAEDAAAARAAATAAAAKPAPIAFDAGSSQRAPARPAGSDGFAPPPSSNPTNRVPPLPGTTTGFASPPSSSATNPMGRVPPLPGTTTGFASPPSSNATGTGRVPPLPGSSGGFASPPTSSPGNRPAARRIVEVAGGGAGGSAGAAGGAARTDGALEVVTLDDGSAAHATVMRALVMDGYAPLVARHGLEALALLLRKGPSLAILPESARGFSGRLIAEEVRRRRELDGTALVLVDASAAPDPALRATARWREVPDDVARVRGAIDRLLDETGAKPAARAPVADARALAEAMAALGHALEDKGLIDEAAAALRYAGELAPTVATHALRLARLLLSIGDARATASPGPSPTDEAASLVERVIRLEPLSVEALLMRALILDRRGNRELARAALKRAGMLAPQHPEVMGLTARLDEGLPLEPPTATDVGAGKAERTGALGKLKRLFGG